MQFLFVLYLILKLLSLLVLFAMLQTEVWEFYYSFHIETVLVVSAVACYLLIPNFCLGMALNLIDIGGLVKFATLAIDTGLCLGAIVLGAYFSIIKYRREGYCPCYAAFITVCVYAVLLAVMSFAFIL